MDLIFHHVGCLVDDIPTALKTYAGTNLAANASEPITINPQKVRVCFLALGNGGHIEFVEPMPDNEPLHRMLRKGTSFYHVGYLCADLEASLQQMIATGAKELTRFQSEAFEGRCCVFLVTEQKQLLELIQSA